GERVQRCHEPAWAEARRGGGSCGLRARGSASRPYLRLTEAGRPPRHASDETSFQSGKSLGSSSSMAAKRPIFSKKKLSVKSSLTCETSPTNTVPAPASP